MKCDLCKKAEATVHLTTSGMPGGPIRLDICEECALKKNINDPTGFSLADLMLEIGKKENDSN